MSFLIDWFYNIWSYFGFMNRNSNLTIVGLGNAGKTTLVNYIVNDLIRVYMPTQKPNKNTFKSGNTTFNAFDLGGQKILRRLWRDYILDPNTIIVFVIDTADMESFTEAKAELQHILTSSEVSQNPIVIVGTKTDIPNHLNRQQLIQALDLQPYMLGINTDINSRPLEVLTLSVVKREGVKELLLWLTQCSDYCYKRKL
ncbi:ARF/SAR superfamily protein [Tieghemostelium lacteum]|uniref:ARF/SAR superfamily protein n=1 Tax=Tieghemostelium lacteum TaxID=361077 RepID=A0A151Z9S4_TIELA|nr:ARF/SAR superfamily protein [Tieghemostelium lacteum]|eukprot:KYQ90683.1 ARF/SAR superfamily protein [Tieghemostelium lacteum]